MTQKIMLTVDVEAFPARASGDPVDQLIWGRFPSGDFGIGTMMDAGDRHGAGVTMFLDYSEANIHGEGILDVGREVVRRGHDLALHLHLDFFPAEMLASAGLLQRTLLNEISEDQAMFVLDALHEIHAKVTSRPLLSYRGGGYRYDLPFLRALVRQGIPISSNYNLAALDQPFDFGETGPFLWDNGTVEVPVSTLRNFRKRDRHVHFNFDISLFSGQSIPAAVQTSRDFLAEIRRRTGDDSIACFVLHSRSFLKMDANGKFSIPIEDAPDRLDAMLKAWKEDGAEFVTSPDIFRIDPTEFKAAPHALAV